jgi:putative lipoic acid-binding regulatory protein
MKTAVLVLFVSMSVLLQAQNTSQVRDVEGFTKIQVSEGIKVELTMGDKYYVEVFADEEVIDRIITCLSGKELNIYIENNVNRFSSNKKIRNVKVKITAKKIKSLDVSSGAHILSTNTIKADKVEFDASSGGVLNVKFESNEASCDASSGSLMKLQGKVTDIEFDVRSGSNIKTSELVAQEVRVDVSSGANISVNAVSKLKVDASSGGLVRYVGSPKFIDIEKSSGGNVVKQ